MRNIFVRTANVQPVNVHVHVRYVHLCMHMTVRLVTARVAYAVREMEHVHYVLGMRNCHVHECGERRLDLSQVLMRRSPTCPVN